MVAPSPPAVAEPLASHTVGRRFLALAVGEAVARLIAFGAMVVVARALGASMYGVVGVATAITLYLNRIVDWGLELGLGVREVAARPEGAARLIPPILLARFGVALAVAGLAIPVGLLLMPQPDGATLAVSALSLLGTGLGARWALLGFGKHRVAGLATVAGQLLTAVLLLALVRGPGDVARVPLALMAGELLLALLVLVALRRDGLTLPLRRDPALVHPLVPRGGALALSALLGIVIYNSGFLFLRGFEGSAAVGYYNAGYTLVTFFLNVGTAYSMSLLPSLAALQGDRDRQVTLFQTAALHVSLLAWPVALGGALLATQVVLLLYGPGYQPAGPPFALLLWCIPLCVVRDLPLMVLQSAGRESVVLRVTAYAAILNLALNAALVPRYGVVGAAAASVITEGVRLVIAAATVWREGFVLPGLTRWWRLALSGGVMAGVVLLLPLATPLRILAGALAYLGALLLTGAIRLGAGLRPSLAL